MGGGGGEGWRGQAGQPEAAYCEESGGRRPPAKKKSNPVCRIVMFTANRLLQSLETAVRLEKKEHDIV